MFAARPFKSDAQGRQVDEIIVTAGEVPNCVISTGRLEHEHIGIEAAEQIVIPGATVCHVVQIGAEEIIGTIGTGNLMPCSLDFRFDSSGGVIAAGC